MRFPITVLSKHPYCFGVPLIPMSRCDALCCNCPMHRDFTTLKGSPCSRHGTSVPTSLYNLLQRNLNIPEQVIWIAALWLNGWNERRSHGTTKGVCSHRCNPTELGYGHMSLLLLLTHYNPFCIPTDWLTCVSPITATIPASGQRHYTPGTWIRQVSDRTTT
jgi:hypothetical protein